MATVVHLVQIEPKNGFETEKVKDGYRQCGYLPQPPTSRNNHAAIFNKKKHVQLIIIHCQILRYAVVVRLIFFESRSATSVRFRVITPG